MLGFFLSLHCIGFWRWQCGKNDWHLEGRAASSFRTAMIAQWMMITGVLFCCWPLLTVMETYQRRNCLLRVPWTPVVRTYWGACKVCFESRPAIPSNAVQPKGFKFWLARTVRFPFLCVTTSGEPMYQRYVSCQLSVTWHSLETTNRVFLTFLF